LKYNIKVSESSKYELEPLLPGMERATLFKKRKKVDSIITREEIPQ
jgi:hypothetical protein